LRPTFRWDHSASLRISDEAIFWLRDDEQTSVIVHQPTKVRIVLDSVGDFIWRRIAGGEPREAVVEELVEHYGVASVTAASDLDDLVEELLDARILVKEPFGYLS
jgi:5'(3')-deoxyribonucleotidase